MKKLVVFFILLSLQQTSAQMSDIETATLANYLHKKVNTYRKKHGYFPYERDKKLAEAAAFQADYMASKNELKETQENELYRTSQKRVLYFTTDFDEVDETVSVTRRIAAPFSSKKLSIIATMVFNAWKKSPSQRKKLVSSTFSYSDYGFSYNKDVNQIFISHVFASKKHKVPNQLSEFGFGIQPKIKTNNKLSNDYENAYTSIGNSISIQGDEVIMSYNDKAVIENILTSDNDGFAIDLVSTGQLNCSGPNQLDASSVYDGILLQPVYKAALLETNRAENDQHFVVSLGQIPGFLRDKVISANLIILKNNAVYQYKIASSIPSNQYALMPITPELHVPDIDLHNGGIHIAHEVFFDFELSQTTTDKYTEANFNLDNVHSFDIRSFTSVDGSERANKIIQDKRAAFIKDHIINKFGLASTPITINAKENWDLFDYQLELYGYKDKLNLSKSEKRAFANHVLKNDWERQFSQQRKSKIIAFQHGYWNIKNKQNGFYNLLNGLLTNDTHLVNKSLVVLYQQDEVNYVLDKDYILDRLLTNKDLVQNVAALFVKNSDEYNVDNMIYFINYWLTRSEILTVEAQKNLLNLYAHTTLKVIKNWNEDSINSLRILNPTNVEKLFNVYKTKSTVDALYINYHLAKIQYYQKMNELDTIKASSDFVLENYKANAKSVTDKINVSLLFNYWNRFDLSKGLLYEDFVNDELNEEAVFVLLQTVSGYNSGLEKSELLNIHEKAITFNKKRWCDWIHTNFQNLRDQQIKDLHCSLCKE